MLKVSKFQKQIFLFSFEPKNQRNYFLHSALASKKSRIKKMKALYYIIRGRVLMYQTPLFFDLTYSRSLGQKSKNNLVRFLVQMKTLKSPFEIN